MFRSSAKITFSDNVDSKNVVVCFTTPSRAGAYLSEKTKTQLNELNKDKPKWGACFNQILCNIGFILYQETSDNGLEILHDFVLSLDNNTVLRQYFQENVKKTLEVTHGVKKRYLATENQDDKFIRKIEQIITKFESIGKFFDARYEKHHHIVYDLDLLDLKLSVEELVKLEIGKVLSSEDIFNLDKETHIKHLKLDYPGFDKFIETNFRDLVPGTQFALYQKMMNAKISINTCVVKYDVSIEDVRRAMVEFSLDTDKTESFIESKFALRNNNNNDKVE